MSKTLFDATYQLARALAITSEGTATGGSTTTIIDTVERTEADDYWNNGSAWIIYDAGGLGAAPQGEYSLISDFAQTGGVVTLRTTLTAAAVSGDRYAIARKKFPLSLLIQKVNEALSTMVIEKNDTTTVTFSSDQTEYSLPANVIELKEVWVQGNSDSDDNKWERIYDYYIQKSATGTANKVVFNRQFSSGDYAKLVYTTYHTDLVAATDKIDDSLNLNKVVYNAAVAALLWRKSKVGESDPTVNELLNYFQAKSQAMNIEHAQELPKKSAKTIHPLFDRP